VIIEPKELPELRAQALEWIRGQRYLDAVREWNVPWPAFADKLTAEHKVQIESAGMRGADLFYVSRQMGAVAAAGAPTLPRFTLEPEDVPALEGLIFFQDSPITVPHGEPPEPMIDYEIAAVMWMGHEKGVLLFFYTDRDRMLESLVREGIAEPQDAAFTRSIAPRIFTMAGRNTWIPWRAIAGDEHSAKLSLAVRTLRAAWLLMQQPLATLEDVQADRHARRRLQRAGHEPAAVRVIRLRRATHSTGTGESDREYHHQWIVRGHWRQQWYPSREVHRPVWIAPHVKGPEGAPLLGGEKVHAWVR
jgi:hypothetical protein